MTNWQSFSWQVILAALVLMPRLSFAEDLPDWALKKPKDDSSYKYYVGRAVDLPNDAQAIEAATKAAMVDAIRDNFGTTAQIQNQTYETSNTTSVVSKATEQSQAVKIEEFNLQDSVIIKNERGYSAWSLFRYSKAAIDKERLRLSKSREITLIDFAEIGNATSKSQLEITTDPEGAYIYVDGEKVLGKTPLRLNGQLEVGKHNVQIEHPEFQTIERDIIINPNAKVSIKEILVPAKGFLNIQTQPSGASILLNGQYVGTSPINKLEVPAGRPVKIDFIHIDAEKSSEEVRVAKEELKNVSKVLPLKPAMLQVLTTPSDAEVIVDGKETSSRWITVDPGDHFIRVSKDGFEIGSESVELRGGERRTVKLSLNPVSEIERRKDLFPWIVGIGIGFYGSTYQSERDLTSVGLGISVEKKFYGLLGFKLMASMIGADEKSEDSVVPARKMEGSIYTASLPIYLSHFYFSPQYGVIKQEITCKTSSCQKLSLSQTFFSGLVGYQYFWQQFGVDASYGFSRYSDDGSSKGKSGSLLQISLLYLF